MELGRCALQRTRFGIFICPSNQLLIYPLHTALLSDSRWIGNPTNHSGTTVSVSPSCLSAARVFEPCLCQGILLAEVGWESDSEGFEWERGWVVCVVSVAGFTYLMLNLPPWNTLAYSMQARSQV